MVLSVKMFSRNSCVSTYCLSTWSYSYCETLSWCWSRQVKGMLALGFNRLFSYIGVGIIRATPNDYERPARVQRPRGPLRAAGAGQRAFWGKGEKVCSASCPEEAGLALQPSAAPVSEDPRVGTAQQGPRVHPGPAARRTHRKRGTRRRTELRVLVRVAREAAQRPAPEGVHTLFARRRAAVCTLGIRLAGREPIRPERGAEVVNAEF